MITVKATIVPEIGLVINIAALPCEIPRASLIWSSNVGDKTNAKRRGATEKPYFFKYRYPACEREYNEYIESKKIWARGYFYKSLE